MELLSALLLASVPVAAHATTPAVSIDASDVFVFDFAQEATFRKQIFKAIELKRQGQTLKAFRTLYDQIAVPAGEEEKALDSLGRSSCSEGKNQQCLFVNERVSVPEQPAPADITDLPSLYLRGPASGSNEFHPVLFTWNLLNPQDSDRIAAWNEQAASGLPFSCEAQTRVCHQLFRVSAVNEDNDRSLRDDALLHLADGTVANPTLAICELERIGPSFGPVGSAIAPVDSRFGPPDKCIAVLAQAKGAAYAVSVSARGLWANLPGLPIRLCCGEDPPPLLRVHIRGLPEDWLVKAITEALGGPALNLQAVATGPRVVLASTGFRNSPLLAPLGEWGSFELWVEPHTKGWLVTLEHADLRVTREANSSDLRHATDSEESRYERSIRDSIRNFLVSACARLPHKCNIAQS